MKETKYRRLTYQDRNTIERMSKAHKSQKEIAQALGVSASCISRELNRNSHNGKYSAIIAHLFAFLRRFWVKKKSKLTPEVVAVLLEHLRKKKRSLECIANTVLKGIVCTQTLYNFIHKMGLHTLLFFGRKYRKRGATSYKGKIKNRISIEERPEESNARNRLGDWEADLIVGSNHKGAMLTLVDRCSRLTIAQKLDFKDAESTARAIIKSLKNCESHTITFDNGKEFSCHESVTKTLGIDAYFAHPYAPQERGTNENTNRLIRRFFPKKTDLRKASTRKVNAMLDELNNRPRKMLGWLSPLEWERKLRVSRAAP